MTIQASAEVSSSATVSQTAQVWHLAQIRENAVIGEHVVIGRGAYIGPGVVVGDSCKVQNFAMLYEPALIEAGVFIGPGAVLTNDLWPRAVNVDGSMKQVDEWRMVGVTIREGASIGANAVCVAPVTIGRWAMVAAGAVAASDVPDFALVAGVPARHIGWVGRSGRQLERQGESVILICPETGDRFVEMEGRLHEDA